MAISLKKGGNISLKKAASDSGSSSNFKKLIVGLGWDSRVTDGDSFDLDAIAFILNDSGTVRSDKDFIFYNQLKTANGSVIHLGDNTHGKGEGDDEQVEIDLSLLDDDINKISLCVTIHDAESRCQNFGMVENAYVRVVNDSDGVEIARYDLTEDAAMETAMVFAELYKRNNEWKFKAIGQGFTGGLQPLAQKYGVNV